MGESENGFSFLAIIEETSQRTIIFYVLCYSVNSNTISQIVYIHVQEKEQVVDVDICLTLMWYCGVR